MAKISDKKIWNFISNVTCCTVTAKDIPILYYVKTAKTLRVEDTDNMMAYSVIRDSVLEYAGLEMTVAELEQWLIEKGIRKVVQKRKPARMYSQFD